MPLNLNNFEPGQAIDNTTARRLCEQGVPVQWRYLGAHGWATETHVGACSWLGGDYAYRVSPDWVRQGTDAALVGPSFIPAINMRVGDVGRIVDGAYAGAIIMRTASDNSHRYVCLDGGGSRVQRGDTWQSIVTFLVTPLNISFDGIEL